MVNSPEFAKRLQEILNFYSLSVTAFSEKIDFNRSTISHLLSARNKPSLEFVMKVLKTFPEVELYWLLNGVGSFPSTSEKLEPSQNLITKPSDEKVISNFESVTKTEISTSAEEKVNANISEVIKKTNSKIDRIVIFFKDGSFQSYE